jgi:heptosyltransferase-2
VSRGKILVIRGGAIGDFILTLPVFSALREQFPETHLEVLGYPHIATLAESGGLVDATRSIEARTLAGFFAKNGALDGSLQDYFAEFAIIISYLYDPDGVFEENVRRSSKAQFIVGPHRPNERMNLHATEVFLKPLERLAIFAPDSTPRLKIRIDSNAKRTAGPLTPALSPNGGEGESSARFRGGEAARVLAIHPGSGSERKNWPEAKWAETIGLLLKSPELKIVLVGGEAEGDRLVRLAVPCSSERIEVLQNQPLVEVARRLSECSAFLGHDSGISHLAAALGLPTIVLWGESNQAIWRPKGPKVVVLKSEVELHSIAPASVLNALESAVCR